MSSADFSRLTKKYQAFLLIHGFCKSSWLLLSFTLQILTFIEAYELHFYPAILWQHMLLISALCVLNIWSIYYSARLSAQFLLLFLWVVDIFFQGALPADFARLFPEYASYAGFSLTWLIFMAIGIVSFLFIFVISFQHYFSGLLHRKSHKYRDSVVSATLRPHQESIKNRFINYRSFLKKFLLLKRNWIVIGILFIMLPVTWLLRVGIFQYDAMIINPTGEIRLSNGRIAQPSQPGTMELGCWGGIPPFPNVTNWKNVTQYYTLPNSSVVRPDLDLILTKLGSVKYAPIISIGNETTVGSLSEYEPVVTLWASYGLRLCFCICTVGFQTSRTMFQWCDIAHRVLDWVQARNLTTIVIGADMEAASPWYVPGSVWSSVPEHGFPTIPYAIDTEFDDAVRAYFEEMAARADSLGVDLWACPAAVAIYDHVDSDNDLALNEWQTDFWNGWDRLQPQLYTSLGGINRELMHLPVEYAIDARNRVMPCLSPQSTLEELVAAARLCRLYGCAGINYWPGYYSCTSSYHGLFNEYGNDSCQVGFTGIFAIIDELNRPLEDLEPISIRTAVMPDETISHFIDKLHGDRFLVSADIGRDLVMNFGRNGTFVFLLFINGLLLLMICMKLFPTRASISPGNRHDAVKPMESPTKP
nr:hypothetical protein [Candidatus Sigynarchaeota archaeon]